MDVPGGISVTGADDDFYLRNMNITTVKEPCRDIGKAATEMHFRKIAANAPHEFLKKGLSNRCCSKGILRRNG